MSEPYPVHVLLPCLNEELSVEPMVRSLSEAFADETLFRVSVVFIDDGSQDRTWEEIERVRREDWHVAVGGIRLEQHAGKGLAQAIGLREMAAQPGMVILMDSDGQHDPSLLPAAVRACHESQLPQIARRTDYRRRGMSSAGTLVLSVIGGITGVRFDPTLGEFVVIPQKTVRALARNPQLGVVPIVPLIQGAASRWETFAAPVLERSDGTGTTRWSKGQLWHKAILLMLANPWAMLPRVAIAIVATVVVLGSYGMAVGIASVVDGTFLGVGSVLVAMVLMFAVLAGLQVITLGLLVVLFKSGSNAGITPDIEVHSLPWGEDRL